MNNGISVYRGRRFDNKQRRHAQKVIVLDLDETLGSFAHLHILWMGIVKGVRRGTLDKATFFRLFSLYPEFLRDNIRELLSIINEQKGQNVKVFLYTNNQCHPDDWIDSVVEYIEETSNTPNLFDHFVRAFKIKDRVIEPLRTSTQKNIDDLVNCTKIPKNAEICFIDDTYYPRMMGDNVYYIHPVAYYHSMSIENIINRYIASSLGSELRIKSSVPRNYRSYIQDWFDFNNAKRYIPHTYNAATCKAGTQRLIAYIRDFFSSTDRKDTSSTGIKASKTNTTLRGRRTIRNSTYKSRARGSRSPSEQVVPAQSASEK